MFPAPAASPFHWDADDTFNSDAHDLVSRMAHSRSLWLAIGAMVVLASSTSSQAAAKPAETGPRYYRVSLRAPTGHYVCAEENGGLAVVANRSELGAWETFTLVDVNGGSLSSGDQIRISTSLGYAFCADDGGALNASRMMSGDWELFTIPLLSEGSIRSGARVAIRSRNGYFVAEDGGGGVVNANRARQGPWEAFTIDFYRATILLAESLSAVASTGGEVGEDELYFANLMTKELIRRSGGAEKGLKFDEADYWRLKPGDPIEAVSYTHLTLPTSDLV